MKSKNTIDCMVMVKDEEGKIVEFETDDVVVAAPKKKKKVAKTVRAGAETNLAMVTGQSIEAEDTLAMIKNALKAGSGKMVADFREMEADTVPKKKTVKKSTVLKKAKEPKMPKLEENKDEAEESKGIPAGGVEVEEDFQVAGDLETADTANRKAGGKKAKKAKKAKKKKERVDGITRFFNDYGESPHLQAIEMSYLTYLEAQHAKESHLKAVKKMQILRALKTI